MKKTRSRRTRPKAPGAGSLASGAGFEAYVLDQLAELDGVVPRKMFGGV